MFKRVFFALLVFLFISQLSYADLTTYEMVGVVNGKNHNDIVKSVKSALSKDFKVVATTNAAGNKDYTILILQDDDFYAALDNTKRYSFFAAPLKVGIEKNKVMFLNPVYTAAAFAKGKRKVAKAAKIAKKKLEESLSKVAGITLKKKDFGYETDEEEIGDWQMMGKSIYLTHKIGSKQFKSIDNAVAAVNKALSKKTNGWSKAYELKLKNAVVIGVTNPKFEKEAFEIGGSDHLCAFPIEVVVMDKGSVGAFVLPEMYRMSLYFMDAGMAAFSAHMSMPGAIDASLDSLLK